MALEPLAGQVYFSPECHAAYAELGFAPEPGFARRRRAVAGRSGLLHEPGSVMGQVPGEVVAAAFAVFNPEAVVPAVEFGWSKVDAPTICAARTRGAVDQLVRILGPEPAGAGARHRAARGRGGSAAAGGQASVRRAAQPRAAGRPDGRRLAPGRPAARVPGRRPYGGLDVGRARRHRGRVAHRALLGPPDAHLCPHPSLVRRSSSTQARAGCRTEASWLAAR